LSPSASEGLGALGYDGALTCALECADLDRSIAWYRDVLGLELMYRVDEIAWAELQSVIAGVTVGLAQVETVHPKGGATLTWGVVDCDAARSQLEALDVRFDGETMTVPEMVKLATFFDPDGNTHMLAQDLSVPSG